MIHKARKRFGQNFLIDHNVIFKIIDSINAQKGEHWVEIGPGLGAITEPLLAQDISLDVIELDRNLVRLLKHKFRENNKLTLHSADVLNFNFFLLPKKGEKLRIVGNLPYNISTTLLFYLLNSINFIEDMHFMLQKEIVERICAKPGSKIYGRLTVMMQLFCKTELVFYVLPESFNPIPKVTSAMIRLIPHQKLALEAKNLKYFSDLVTSAFSQRRKTIQNSLKKLITKKQIISVGINPKLRAESITLAQFIQLSMLPNTLKH